MYVGVMHSIYCIRMCQVSIMYLGLARSHRQLLVVTPHQSIT